MLRKPLGLESLERRALMAGDVTAQVIHGALVIEGDKADNQIILSNTAEGALSVQGLGDTTINGDLAAFTTTARIASINVRLGEGADRLEVQGLAFRGNLNASLGKGDDSASIAQSAIDGFVSINAGADNDTLAIGTNPLVSPTGAAAIPENVQLGSLSLALGEGANVLSVTGTQIRRDLLVQAGSGADRLSLGLFGGPSASALVDDASGFDVEIGGFLSLFTGAGDDLIRTNSVTARIASLATDGGNDTVTASNTRFDFVFAQLGDGDDVLDGSGGNNVINWLFVAGGRGDDSLFDAPTNTLNHVVQAGFETVA
ncbi:MAG: hypothetical protein K1X74_04710 [Pirellulales bacterium]|nr:hypothetical protein [Pirellulales bacterium]